ncbi:MAG TPA: hypothetical protein VII38_19945, partial [Polyangia bacterium]
IEANWPLASESWVRVLIFLALFAVPFALARTLRVLAAREWKQIAGFSPLLGFALAILLGQELRRAGLARGLTVGASLAVAILGCMVGWVAGRTARQV